jgi:hypothetical protein
LFLVTNWLYFRFKTSLIAFNQSPFSYWGLLTLCVIWITFKVFSAFILFQINHPSLPSWHMMKTMSFTYVKWLRKSPKKAKKFGHFLQRFFYTLNLRKFYALRTILFIFDKCVKINFLSKYILFMLKNKFLKYGIWHFIKGILCLTCLVGKRSLDRISLDRNCHFSLDRKF